DAFFDEVASRIFRIERLAVEACHCRHHSVHTGPESGATATGRSEVAGRAAPLHESSSWRNLRLNQTGAVVGPPLTSEPIRVAGLSHLIEPIDEQVLAGDVALVRPRAGLRRAA